jgi:hypothetical protein
MMKGREGRDALIALLALMGAKPPPVAPKTARFVVRAINGYLKGRHDSLDHAFGLVRDGNPGKDDARLAVEVAKMQLARIRWKQIVDAVERTTGQYRAQRTLQELLEKYPEAKVIAKLERSAKSRARVVGPHGPRKPDVRITGRVSRAP